VHNLAELISALASLAWPVITLTIICLFRTELGALLTRLRKGKLLGTEFELDELQAKAITAEAMAGLPTISARPSVTRNWETDSPPEAATGPEPPAYRFQLDARSAQDAIEEVLREAARSPRLGLMLLSSKIERAARELGGLDVSRDRPVPLGAVISVLVRTEQIPSEAAEALNLFNQVRNRIVHGHDADDDEITRAIDSGTRLLRLLLLPPKSAMGGSTEEG
jgi:hypothetical protein